MYHILAQDSNLYLFPNHLLSFGTKEIINQVLLPLSHCNIKYLRLIEEHDGNWKNYKEIVRVYKTHEATPP